LFCLVRYANLLAVVALVTLSRVSCFMPCVSVCVVNPVIESLWQIATATADIAAAIEMANR